MSAPFDHQIFASAPFTFCTFSAHFPVVRMGCLGGRGGRPLESLPPLIHFFFLRRCRNRGTTVQRAKPISRRCSEANWIWTISMFTVIIIRQFLGKYSLSAI